MLFSGNMLLYAVKICHFCLFNKTLIGQGTRQEVSVGQPFFGELWEG